MEDALLVKTYQDNGSMWLKKLAYACHTLHIFYIYKYAIHAQVHQCKKKKKNRVNCTM